MQKKAVKEEARRQAEHLLSKTLPVKVSEPELNPKVQTVLDEVMTGVERLSVKSTVPPLEWIEQEVYDKEAWGQLFDEEAWKQFKRDKARLSLFGFFGESYEHIRYDGESYREIVYQRGGLYFSETHPGNLQTCVKATSQPHNYQLTREATSFFDRFDIIVRKRLYKEGMKISYRECRRCGRETWLNFDDHLGECNERFDKILKQRNRLKRLGSQESER